MGGGNLNLASYRGSGDDILSINPQITFFKKVFKRHTNFGIETKEISVAGSKTVDFGNRHTFVVNKSGSLITDMHVEIKLPKANACVSNTNYVYWINNVGHALLESVELLIQNNVIEKHIGLWYDIWNELTDSDRREWVLTGKRDDDYGDFLPSISGKFTKYYIPLKFYFNKNPGLALPIFLLNDNDVKIDIKLAELSKLLKFSSKGNSTAIATNQSIKDFKMFATYIYLDIEEQNRIKTHLPSEYLIETVTINENVTDISSISNVNNPVKEIIWVFRNENRLNAVVPTATTAANGAANYNDNGTNSAATDDEGNHLKKTVTDEFTNDPFNYSYHAENGQLDYGTKDPITDVSIKISNIEIQAKTDATYFRTMQPYKYHSNIPGGINDNEKKKYIYLYSFALNPEEYQPSGAFNFSKKDDHLSFELTDASGNSGIPSGYRMDVFIVCYKYIRFTLGSATLYDVPFISTEFTNEAIVKGAEMELKKKYIESKEQNRNQTPQRHLQKKKWGGFQDEYND